MCDPIVIHSARRVTVALAAATRGLTVKAVNSKIDKGVWVEGKEWFKAPDGRRYIDQQAVDEWIASGRRS